VGLALRGHKTAVIDFDVGLRNLDLIMGCERRVVYDLINVIHGEANLQPGPDQGQAVRQPLCAGRQPDARQGRADQEGVERVLAELAEMGFEYIVCDSPAGIETGALMAMHYADEALVVTNPEVSSVRDSDRILGMLSSKTKRAIDGSDAGQGAPADHPLQPQPGRRRADAEPDRHPGDPAHSADRRDPRERDGAGRQSNQGVPAIHLKTTDVSEAYKDVISRFLGETVPMRFTDFEKPGFFKRLFGGR
jgi:septum site-determining protein MinD